MSTARQRIKELLGQLYPREEVDLEDISELVAELDAKCRWSWSESSNAFQPECDWRYAANVTDYVVRFYKHCPGCGKEIVSE